MKKIINYIFLFFVLAPQLAKADSFNSLWKQYHVAQDNDQPRTQLSIAERIELKAEKDKSYGDLLAAQLSQISIMETISPDSLQPMTLRLESKAAIEGKKDPVLSAVYNCILGKLYSSNGGQPDKVKSKMYYEKAMSNPRLLAQIRSRVYEPLLKEGLDDNIFGKDLLHVIGLTAEDYHTLYYYYRSAGNRRAACVCAYYIIQQERKVDVNQMQKSKYLMCIDSLIHIYKDVDAAGQLAVEHYKFMSQADDASVKDQLNYINFALAHWGSWPTMNFLRNEERRLTCPQYKAVVSKRVILPNNDFYIYLRDVRNVKQLNVTVEQLNTTADKQWNIDDAGQLALLLKHVNPSKKIAMSRYFLGRANYEFSRDSVLINGLPSGAYLIKVSSDNSDIPSSYDIFYVSDIAVVHQKLPDGKIRLGIVSATTGHPLSGAEIQLYSNKGKISGSPLTCDDDGEVVFQKDRDVNSFFAYTENDRYCPKASISDYYGYFDGKSSYVSSNIYTDRTLYRPGQTVHVAAVFYRNKQHQNVGVIAGEKVQLVCTDANWKEVGTKDLITDAYGTVSTDFVLPDHVLTGRFVIKTSEGGGAAYIDVEEYKRPTFEVTFPKINARYQAGDTLIVKATAQNYTGFPVQGAKVKYTVVRQPFFWWWHTQPSQQKVLVDIDSLITDANGHFNVVIPLVTDVIDTKTPCYYRYVVNAEVTDRTGESHSQEIDVPLGSHPTVFSCNLPEQILRPGREKSGQDQHVKFTYLNLSGQEIKATVRYSIDGGNWKEVTTNTDMLLYDSIFDKASVKDGLISMLPSGRHTLEAICEKDTLKKDFDIFSMDDKAPISNTHCWFYQTAGRFSENSEDSVYVQIGSSDPSVHVLYTIVSGNTLLENKTFELNKSLCTRAFSYKPEYGNGIVISYAWVKDGITYTQQARIEKPLPSKNLHLSWSTFRNRLVPGQKEQWTLNIKDDNQHPVRAQVIASLYDKSLDQLKPFTWTFFPNIYINLPSVRWNYNRGGYEYGLTVSNMLNETYYDERELDFGQIDQMFLPLGNRNYNESVFNAVGGEGSLRKSRALQAKSMLASGATSESGNKLFDAVEQMPSTSFGSNVPVPEGSSSQLRENLIETAFFYPNIESDDKGNAKISFTLPESVTTWRFLGFAHDKEMRYGFIDGETVASKQIMIQPNLPRFLRQGDDAVIKAQISNTSNKVQRGVALLQFINPESQKIVFTQTVQYQVEPGESETVAFNLNSSSLDPDLYIVRVIAKGNGFSDGEQHYMPVISHQELILNTLPFTLDGIGDKVIDLQNLTEKTSVIKGKSSSDQPRYTLEYTNNPAWMMVQALPALSTPQADNAIDIAAAYYSNRISKDLLYRLPQIKTVIDLWKHNSKDEVLNSELARNEELKQLLLSETPWVLDADKETGQRQALINYFDVNQVEQRLSDDLGKLKSLQNIDGSWSWWKGMSGSRELTQAVATILARLHVFSAPDSSAEDMLQRAIAFMQGEVSDEVKNMKKDSINDPSEFSLHYLYILAIDDAKLNKEGEADKQYLLHKLATMPAALTIYGKARGAVIFAKNNMMKQARQYLQSAEEYTVQNSETGRYYDTPKAYYSWRDYRIPTEVAVIEAYHLLKPQDTKSVEEMQRWLLLSKRTQLWDTPVNSVDAVSAFMTDSSHSFTTDSPKAIIKIDSHQLKVVTSQAGLGYIRATFQGNKKKLSIEKKNNGISWGAVYVQTFQDVSDIAAKSSGITVTRELLEDKDKSADVQGTTLHVGDKVKVRITLKADRDYDFVEVVDKRAACLEPVAPLSGYQRSYYITPKDNVTNYYFDRLSKGTHVIETEYYIDREGNYQSGSCTAQCAYSPAYQGRAASVSLIVK